MSYYSICLRGDRFVAVREPKHNNYEGHVYGTFNKHPNAESAIQEYQEYIKKKYNDGLSSEEHARSDLNRMPTLNHRISSLVELVKLIKEETKPK